MKTIIALGVLILVTPAFAQVSDRDLDQAEKNIHKRGGTIDHSVRGNERESVKEAAMFIAKAYRDKGDAPSKAEKYASEKTLTAWGYLRDPKEGRSPNAAIKANEFVAYSKSLGRLTIRSTPTGAAITIDTDSSGTTVTSKWLSEGEHKVAVTLPGYDSQEKTVVTKSGTNDTLDFTLTKSK